MKKSEEWATDYLNGKVTTQFGTIRGSVGWGEMFLAVLFDKFAEEAVEEYKARVAQLVERRTSNAEVIGSNPIAGSNIVDGLGPRAREYHNVQELRD